MLKRVVAAEEITEVAPEAEGDAAKGLITKNQMNFLKLIAKRIDINIPKYINMGKTKYDKLEDVPYATAVKMVGVLSEFQRKKEKIPDAIKGWKE
jgi:hypothetical protein